MKSAIPHYLFSIAFKLLIAMYVMETMCFNITSLFLRETFFGGSMAI